jgi:malonate transporter
VAGGVLVLCGPGDGGLHRRGDAECPHRHLKDAPFGALVAAFPNTGFMGVPLLVACWGRRPAGPVICTVLADLFITSSLCIALSQAGRRCRAHRAWARAAALRALQGRAVEPAALVDCAGRAGCRPPG